MNPSIYYWAILIICISTSIANSKRIHGSKVNRQNAFRITSENDRPKGLRSSQGLDIKIISNDVNKIRKGSNSESKISKNCNDEKKSGTNSQNKVPVDDKQMENGKDLEPSKAVVDIIKNYRKPNSDLLTKNAAKKWKSYAEKKPSSTPEAKPEKVEHFIDVSHKKSLFSWAKANEGLESVSNALNTVNSAFELYRNIYDIYCQRPARSQNASGVKCGTDYSQVQPQQVAFHDQEKNAFYDYKEEAMNCQSKTNCYYMKSSSATTTSVSALVIILISVSILRQHAF